MDFFNNDANSANLNIINTDFNSDFNDNFNNAFNNHPNSAPVQKNNSSGREIHTSGIPIARTHCKYEQTDSQLYIPIQPQHYYPDPLYAQQQQQSQQQQYAYYPQIPTSAYDALALTIAPSEYFAQGNQPLYYDQPSYYSQPCPQPFQPLQALQPQQPQQYQQPVDNNYQFQQYEQVQQQQQQQQPEIISTEPTRPGELIGRMASPTRRGPSSFQRLNKVRE